MGENLLQHDCLREASRSTRELLLCVYLKLFLQDRKLCDPTKPTERNKDLSSDVIKC